MLPSDDSAEKRRQLHKLIQHQNQPDEPRRRPWLVKGIVLVGIVAAAGLYFGLVRKVWELDQQSRLDQPAPATAQLPPAAKVDQLSPAELQQILAGDDVDSQREAIIQLAKLHPPEAATIESLAKLLTHAELAPHAVDALGAIGFEAHQAAADLQKLAAEEGAPAMRRRAVAALLRINPFFVVDLPPQADADLLALLASQDEITRRYAAACLGARQAQGANIEKALTELLNDENDERIAAIARLALSQIRGAELPTPAGELIERASSDLDYIAAEQLVRTYSPDVVVELVFAMTRNRASDASGPPTIAIRSWGAEAAPSLIEVLRSDDVRSKELAAELLEELGPIAAPAVPALIVCLDDPRGRVRICAVEALRAIGPAANEAIGPLSEMTLDRREIDLAVALYCLEPTPRRLDSARKLIEPKLPGPDNQFETSWHQLKQLQPRPIAWLVELMGDSPNGFCRRNVSHVLIEEAERVEAHVDQLAQLLSRPPAPIRTFDDDQFEPARLAADVLAAIGPPAASATDDLLKQLDSPSWRIRRSSARALGRVATRESAPRIVKALRATPRDASEASLAAEFAIRQIGVRLGPDLSDMPKSTRAAIASTAPYAQRVTQGAALWTPPYDANIDPPSAARPSSIRRTLPDYVADSEHFGLGNRGDAERILEFGEGPLPAQSAAPLLLLLHERHRLEFHRGREHEAIVHALWRLTQSPLIPAIMVDARVAPAQTVREMGSVGGALGPFLHGHKTAYGMPAALLLPLIGPRAHEELPALWGQLKRSDGGIFSGVAGLTIWRLEENRDVATELMRQLKPERAPFVEDCEGRGDRQHIAWALGRIGPPAKAAIPLLAEVAYRDTRAFGVAAAWAARQIDPQAAAEWGLK
ncbi:hypothetical protein M4951_11485 [Blastopirellula sp. J2-11]|uniref:HEAT repeat domain-containing protein n=1 Tax=Blastopirellula sp. J2-11 TaxID=2943192 RepID=UPI0021C6FAEB|nr:HEAT repeat domain-containing protein [Blastopirellula sp. J2-11]UUO08913.1 hypothetical protein M4951_11485 [Blastopirellula sp. J2-11]